MGTIAQVVGAVKSYDWGKTAPQSLVSQFYNLQVSDIDKIAQGELCAELWLGCHPSAPARVIGPTSSPLSQWIGEQGAPMPYLLKILSIEKALSLQLHPNKDVAVLLHSKNAERYPDDNDKPEMAVALSDRFELLCGFRKIKDIHALFTSITPLQAFVKSKNLWKHSDGDITRSLMRAIYEDASDSDIERILKEILEFADQQENTPSTAAGKSSASGIAEKLVQSVKTLLASDSPVSNKQQLAPDALRLFLRLHSQFPNDRGLFCAFLLSHMTLERGECVGLPPNTIHAYISGDCCEIMKTSDNVIRIGLTPKYRDVEVLAKFVTYKLADPSKYLIKEQEVTDHLTAFVPSFTNAFRLYSWKSDASITDVALPIPRWYPLQILCIEGQKAKLIVHGENGFKESLQLSRGKCFVLTSWAELILSCDEETYLVFAVPNVSAPRLRRSKKDLADIRKERRTSVTASEFVETHVGKRSVDSSEASIAIGQSLEEKAKSTPFSSAQEEPGKETPIAGASQDSR